MSFWAVWNLVLNFTRCPVGGTPFGRVIEAGPDPAKADKDDDDEEEIEDPDPMCKRPFWTLAFAR